MSSSREAKEQLKLRLSRSPARSFMYHGEEGQSFCCGNCGSFMYTTESKCPFCGDTEQVLHLMVQCASPNHNESNGCTNVLCFKFHAPVV